MTTARRTPFEIADQQVRAGTRTQLEIPIARLMSGTPVALPVIVFHGSGEGPTVWINAAIHGDEIGGVDIIRRVTERLDPKSMNGTVIAVPIVNVHGFNTNDRYLPDRRDLNRSFPGSARGPLASRIAHLMMTEIVQRCTVGIDLHTGSDHRTNLPQIRADLDDPQTEKLAQVFGAPIAIHARTRDGSLRQAATEAGATVLLFEGGEALRFSRDAINAGTLGVRRVFSHLGITNDGPEAGTKTTFSRTTKWARAGRSGILHLQPELGDYVNKGELIATILDPYGKRLGRISAPLDGIIVGHTQHPLVNRGDAVVHIATT
ncbi:MAG: succinylglutamate desuccinylase/aspartoacylase family protein [Acidimicrobiales bacterium]